MPYTGSLAIDVEEIRSGYARVCLKDSWRARNHLNCIHAMAIANLAEATTGLALNYGLADHQRAILTAFNVSYLHKARGRLTAECEAEVAADAQLAEISGLVRDAAGIIVAEVKATWKIG